MHIEQSPTYIIAMPTRGVSEKMQRALRKLQHSISASNLNYHNLHHDELQTIPPPTGGSSHRGSNFVGGSMRRGSSFGKSGRLANNSDLDSDDGSDDSAPDDVPEGYLVVYVGEERRRFVINAQILNHPVFRVLLDKSAEEYGFEHKGGLAIACEVVFFEHLLWLIDTKDPSLSRMEVDELVGFYAHS